MYFFDMADYYNSYFIGCGNQNYSTVGDWSDILTTANETRFAFLKSVIQWYSATRAQMPDTICTEFDTYYDDIINYTLDSRYLAFWDLASESSTVNNLTNEIWDDYSALMGETMQKLKQLMMYLDGDTFEPYYP